MILALVLDTVGAVHPLSQIDENKLDVVCYGKAANKGGKNFEELYFLFIVSQATQSDRNSL